MSVQGKVGKWEFSWKSAPRGPAGVAHVEVRDTSTAGAKLRLVEVRWRRDGEGLWLELPDGVRGFDLSAEAGDDGRLLFALTQRGGPGAWQGLAYLRAGEEQAAAGAAGARKHVRVRAQMPGKILRVRVKAGDAVEKGQSLLVMEAMKMENEIRAPQAGKVAALKITEGQAVETGADLCMIE